MKGVPDVKRLSMLKQKSPLQDKESILQIKIAKKKYTKFSCTDEGTLNVTRLSMP